MIRTPLRPTVELNRGWTFSQGKVNRRWLADLEGKGESVTLPHCWNERDTFQMGRHSFTGRGAYRITFDLPEVSTPGRWFLRSEGFYGLVDIWLDGRRLTRTDPQFLGMDHPLQSITSGEHTLALGMENHKRRNVLPGFKAPDFLLYGGLVGKVWLEHRPEPAINLERFSLRTRIDPSGRGSIEVGHGVVNLSTRTTIFDPAGTEAGETTTDTVLIEDPQLWSPDSPNLYRAEITLSDGDRDLDAVHLHFGFVTTEFRKGQGIFLNGKHIDLHGANRHESIPGLGSALPPELQRRDAEHLKALGCNFVRLSHYPQHPAFLNACDELGLLVYPEIATWKSVRSSRGWLIAARRQMRDLILRDRHRPSIILWGMGNESRSKKAYQQLSNIVHDLDPQRSTIYAENHLYRARRKKTLGLPDVWGTNYELDVLEEAAASSRSGTVVVAECCNHPRSIKGDQHEELTQLNALHRDWEAMAEKPYVAGYAVWGLTDYATEHRDRFRRLPGLLDAWRRPKMAAELFRARHSREPFVALFVTGRGPEQPPSRFRRDIEIEPGGAHKIHVFSNSDRVDLVIDGGAPHRLDCAVHFVVTTGAMPEAVEAEGASGGTIVRSSWRRHGPAHRIEVRPTAEAVPGRTLEIDIDVVDSGGTTARDFNGRCRLTIEGPARLRASTENDEALIARGEARTYITCDAVEHGKVHLTATADGLESGSTLISWGKENT